MTDALAHTAWLKTDLAASIEYLQVTVGNLGMSRDLPGDLLELVYDDLWAAASADNTRDARAYLCLIETLLMSTVMSEGEAIAVVSRVQDVSDGLQWQ